MPLLWILGGVVTVIGAMALNKKYHELRSNDIALVNIDQFLPTSAIRADEVSLLQQAARIQPGGQIPVRVLGPDPTNHRFSGTVEISKIIPTSTLPISVMVSWIGPLNVTRDGKPVFIPGPKT